MIKVMVTHMLIYDVMYLCHRYGLLLPSNAGMR